MILHLTEKRKKFRTMWTSPLKERKLSLIRSKILASLRIALTVLQNCIITRCDILVTRVTSCSLWLNRKSMWMRTLGWSGLARLSRARWDVAIQPRRWSITIQYRSATWSTWILAGLLGPLFLPHLPAKRRIHHSLKFFSCLQVDLNRSTSTMNLAISWIRQVPENLN